MQLIFLVVGMVGAVTGCPQGTTTQAAAAVTVAYPDTLKDALAVITKIERALDGEASLDWARLDSDLAEASEDLAAFTAAHPEDVSGRLLGVRVGRLIDLVQPVPVSVDSTGMQVGGSLNRHLELHAELDGILAEEPGLAEALYLKARLYATQHPVIDERGFSTEVDWPASLGCAEAALDLVPTERRYRILYALGLARTGSPDSALVVLESGGLGESLLARMWRDFRRIPIPAGAVVDPQTESAMAEMMGSQIGPYAGERVRAYKGPVTTADLEPLYKARWPAFEWIAPEGDEGVGMQFLRFDRDDFRPVRSEAEARRYTDEGKGVMLMTLIPPTVDELVGPESERILILVNYRRE